MTPADDGWDLRSASDPLRGFEYQLYRSVIEWLRIAKDERLYLERGALDRGESVGSRVDGGSGAHDPGRVAEASSQKVPSLRQASRHFRIPKCAREAAKCSRTVAVRFAPAQMHDAHAGARRDAPGAGPEAVEHCIDRGGVFGADIDGRTVSHPSQRSRTA